MQSSLKNPAVMRLWDFRQKDMQATQDAGSDIVCAAISVLVINTINSVEQFTDSDCTVTQDEENAGIYFRVNSSKNPKELQVLLQSLVSWLKRCGRG